VHVLSGVRRVQTNGGGGQERLMRGAH